MTFDFSTIDLKVILAALALLVALFTLLYFQWWRGRKSLSYDVVSSTPLLTAADEIRNDLQILYRGAPVQNVRLLIIKVINDGYQPIKKDDFDDGLNFDFSEGTQFLSYGVVKTSR